MLDSGGMARIAAMRDRLIAGILRSVPEAVLTGHPVDRLPGNASFVFSGMEGEAIVLNLDFEGIAAGSGSACSAGAVEPSHVLTAMGLSADAARGALRLTLGRDNTDADVDRVLHVLPDIVSRLRALKSGR
jgi:cysteine desulfurase